MAISLAERTEQLEAERRLLDKADSTSGKVGGGSATRKT